MCFCGTVESLHKSESQNKELNRTVQELTAIRMQLQSDRDAMDAELLDSRESIRDLQSRLDSANSVMNQLKVDLDSRLRERDGVIDNLRSVCYHTTQLNIIEDGLWQPRGSTISATNHIGHNHDGQRHRL